MIKWGVFLKKKRKDIIIDVFETKKEAVDELKNRKELCRMLDVNPSTAYKIRKVKE
jgi:hypothetical protein|tara:strand:- start:1735 stop:1902 length:168 start_codon:yes stop_codon:yes gene_type:complete